MNVFHLAIPTHDLDLSEDFYTRIIMASKARRYNDRVTFRFFDHQIVCHLNPEKVDYIENKDPFENLYPRHFGITFDTYEAFESLYQSCIASGWPHVKEKFRRFEDMPESHFTFFVADPSYNLLEFKYYDDEKYMY